MGADVRRRNLGELFQVRSHHVRTQRTVHSDADHRKVRNRIPKRLDHLTRNKRAARFGKRTRNHHRYDVARLFEITRDGKQAGFQIQRVDHGFGKENINAALDQRSYLLVVRSFHFLKRHTSPGRIVDFGADRSLLGGWANRSCHKSLAGRLAQPLRSARSRLWHWQPPRY